MVHTGADVPLAFCLWVVYTDQAQLPFNPMRLHGARADKEGISHADRFGRVYRADTGPVTDARRHVTVDPVSDAI